MDSYSDYGEQEIPCCLDCKHRELKGELYGRTSYWCALTEKAVDSSRVLKKACDRFERFTA
jgi:hypothetical protein